MKILFILASDLNYKYENIFSFNNSFAPLSLATVAGSIPKEYNAEIMIVDEGLQKINYDKLNFDIVAISCCASSSNRAYKLSEYWQKRGAFTVIGGYHATLCPDDVSKHCNSVICGFGEYVFPKLLEDYTNNSTKKIYAADCQNIQKYIEPRRDLIKNIPYSAPNTIYSTRGCVNNCTYCSVNKFSKYVKRPIEEVVEEIKRNKFKKCYFLDSNFVADIDYAKELMFALVPLKIKYYADVTYNAYEDKELMDLLQKSGCFEVFIGFETLKNENLQNSHKYINKTDNYKTCIKEFHKRGISIFGGFMIGMDSDTEESIKSMPEYVKDLGIDVVRYTLFTPLPGTEVFKQYKNENRILTFNYDYYDFMHVVHKPKLLEPQELQELFVQIHKETFKMNNIFSRIYNKHNLLELYLVNMYFKVAQRKIPTKLPY